MLAINTAKIANLALEAIAGSLERTMQYRKSYQCKCLGGDECNCIEQNTDPACLSPSAVNAYIKLIPLLAPEDRQKHAEQLLYITYHYLHDPHKTDINPIDIIAAIKQGLPLEKMAKHVGKLDENYPDQQITGTTSHQMLLWILEYCQAITNAEGGSPTTEADKATAQMTARQILYSMIEIIHKPYLYLITLKLWFIMPEQTTQAIKMAFTRANELNDKQLRENAIETCDAITSSRLYIPRQFKESQSRIEALFTDILEILIEAYNVNIIENDVDTAEIIYIINRVIPAIKKCGHTPSHTLRKNIFLFLMSFVEEKRHIMPNISIQAAIEGLGKLGDCSEPHLLTYMMSLLGHPIKCCPFNNHTLQKYKIYLSMRQTCVCAISTMYEHYANHPDHTERLIDLILCELDNSSFLIIDIDSPHIGRIKDINRDLVIYQQYLLRMLSKIGVTAREKSQTIVLNMLASIDLDFSWQEQDNVYRRCRLEDDCIHALGEMVATKALAFFLVKLDDATKHSCTWYSPRIMAAITNIFINADIQKIYNESEHNMEALLLSTHLLGCRNSYLQQLTEITKHPEPAIARAALDSLGKLGGCAILRVKDLIDCIGKPHEEVQISGKPHEEVQISAMDALVQIITEYASIDDDDDGIDDDGGAFRFWPRDWGGL
jgi:hypothetical protein